MGLKQLLTDLSDGVQNDFTEGIDFKQRSMPWPDSYEEGKPLLTRRNFDEKAFEDLDQGSPEPNPEAISFGRDDGDLSTNRRLDDFRRIGKWIWGTGEGRGWIIKQAGLQLMNPRLDAPQKDLFTSAAEGLTNMFDFEGNKPKDPNQMTYNGGVNTVISTLMAGGGAIDREGGVPFIHSGYIDAIGKKTWGQPGSLGQDDQMDNPQKSTNRLVFLQANKIIGNYPDGVFGTLNDLGLVGTGLGSFLMDAGAALKDALPFLFGDGEELFSYAGGPKSKYGVGQTKHIRYVNSTRDNYGKSFVKIFFDSNMFTATGEFRLSPIALPNFLEVLDSKEHTIKEKRIRHPYFNYNEMIDKDGELRTYHYGSRIGAGDPGKIVDGVDDRAWNQNEDGTITYKAFVPDKIDKLNALDIHTATDSFGDIVYRDFIKFRIEAINNNSPEDALSSDVIVFRAFIDDIGDSFNAEHNEFKYNGRGEYFYTYKGFKRDISLSFKIAAQSRHEMMPLYRKLNFLVSNTAPDYSGQFNRIRTPYQRLSVGSWMNRIPGVITSVSLKWSTDYPWEIAVTEPEEEKGGAPGSPQLADMLVLPHILDVSLNFTPIHNFLPQKGIDSPFILPDWRSPGLTANQQWLSETSQNIDTVKSWLNLPLHERMNDKDKAFEIEESGASNTEIT